MSDKKYSNKRSNVISSLRRKNIALMKEIESYLESKPKSTKLPKEWIEGEIDGNLLVSAQQEGLRRHLRNITTCAAMGIYAFDHSGISYKGSVTCKNKVCFVCNWNRKRTIRRKYFKWFNENQFIVELKRIDKRGYKEIKYTTEAQREKYESKKWVFSKRVGYDLMAFTLSVPHTEIGFCSTYFYYDSIVRAFHNMRKNRDFWNDLVFGGELGLETTKNEKGLHIHIHGLLLTKKRDYSRNKLYKEMLLAWNALTINTDIPKEKLPENRVIGLKKSCPALTDEEITGIDNRGATIISLQTIYSLNKQGEKVRSNVFASDAMMRAVMESIKYHFEPLAFNKDSGNIDLELLEEISDVIYKKKFMYSKFGCLFGETSLNVCEESGDEQDMLEALELVDHDTGEVYERDYYLLKHSEVFHDKDADYEIKLSNRGKKTAIRLRSSTLSGAYDETQQIILSKKKKTHL